MDDSVKVAIMQPYFFPYLGYFHLIDAVDMFIFYTDAQYIRRGWINRNRILDRDQAEQWRYIRVPVRYAPRDARIDEIVAAENTDWRRTFIETIKRCYSRAPEYRQVSPWLFESVGNAGDSLCDINMSTVKAVCGHLGIATEFLESTHLAYDRMGSAENKIMDMARGVKGDVYVNAIGGVSLYNRQNFAASGLDLQFVKSRITPYMQGSGPWIAELSVLDVLMWNSPQNIQAMARKYDLVRLQVAQ